MVAPILFACVGIRVHDDAADSLSAAHDSAHTGIAPPSAANSANPSPLSSSHHPHYPKPPPPLLPDEAGNQTGVSALLLPWEGQEVDPRGSVTFAKELAGHPVNIVGTQRRENAPLRVAEACHFNNPFDYLLNGVKFSYNAVRQARGSDFLFYYFGFCSQASACPGYLRRIVFLRQLCSDECNVWGEDLFPFPDIFFAFRGFNADSATMFKTGKEGSSHFLSLVQSIEEGNTLDDEALDKAETILDDLTFIFADFMNDECFFEVLTPRPDNSADGFTKAILTILTSGHQSLVHLSLQLLRTCLERSQYKPESILSFVCSGFFTRFAPTLRSMMSNLSAESHLHIITSVYSCITPAHPENSQKASQLSNLSTESIRQIIFEQVLRPVGPYIAWCRRYEAEVVNSHKIANYFPRAEYLSRADPFLRLHPSDLSRHHPKSVLLRME
ncbi:hypothetical protein BLNAU_4377 [Blattamonas nauphoetae]|uniref:Uncharacterized protein n=1 Tax=Blattamonas nauphoetae TaxID=2049346 RepID=A0ABQ9YAC1_9EUKA|nr:hypothetical protein BLNAU_4377 [Blattamonas nauphoetae]